MNKICAMIFALASLELTAQDLMYLDGSGTSPHLYVQAGAQVYVQGGVVANNTVSITSGIDGAGDLYLVDGGTSTSSNWSDNTVIGLAVNNASTGTVYMQSGLTQNITGQTTFHNLVANNSSAGGINITANSFLKVKGILTLNDGVMHGINNSHMIITTNPFGSLVQGGSNAGWNNSWMEMNYANGSSFDREITNSGSIYFFPVGNTTQLQLLEVTPTNITGISRLSSSWENGVAGNTPLVILECGTSYTDVNSYGEWHLRPANGGSVGAGSFTAGNMSLIGRFNGAFSGLTDNQFGILFRPQGNSSAAGWVVPTPSCTSLSPASTPGRTVAGDFASRNSVTQFDDQSSQLGIGMTLIPLPIELLSFTGWNSGPVNELMWMTAAELNSDYFDVQRSADGIINNYSAIGRVEAAGISFSPLTYYFTDESPFIGLNYYRLKMVDLDNSFQFSNYVVIELADQAITTMNIYPNPAMNDIQLQIYSQADQDILIELTDVLGRILYAENRFVSIGNNSFSISLAELASASYFITIKNLKDHSSQTNKIVKTN